MENISDGVMPSPTIPLVTRQPLPSASDLLKSAFAYSKSKLPLTLGVIAIPFVLQAIQVFGSPYFPVIISIAINIASFVASFLMGFAVMFIMTRRDIEVTSAFQAYSLSQQYILPGLWVGILSSFVVLGGFFFFVVPGIIMAGFIFLSNYALFVEGKRGFSALSLSWHYVSGYWGKMFWRVFVLGLVIGGCSILAIIAIGIASVVVGLLTAGQGMQIVGNLFGLALIFVVWAYFMPVAYAYYADLYQALRYIKLSEPITEVEEKNKKWKLSALAVLGIFAIVILIVLFGVLLLFLSKFIDLDNGIVPMLPSKQILNMGVFPFIGNATFAQLIQLYR